MPKCFLGNTGWRDAAGLVLACGLRLGPAEAAGMLTLPRQKLQGRCWDGG